MTMKREIMKCPRCEGEGHVVLPDHLQQAMRAVPIGKEVYADDVACRLRITTGAASMRLMDLVLLGKLRRERDGKFWRYSRP